MQNESAVGIVALLWLFGSLLLMVRSIRTGRDLADSLAMRHPDTYEELGRPYPGYFESLRRTRFAQFVGRREFEDLPDPPLVSQFEAYRKSEATLVVGIVSCGAAIALAVYLIRDVA
jgi:hypothetical protein